MKRISEEGSMELGSRLKMTKHSVLLFSADHDPQFVGYAGVQMNF
jgi:hypothetical protein